MLIRWARPHLVFAAPVLGVCLGPAADRSASDLLMPLTQGLSVPAVLPPHRVHIGAAPQQVGEEPDLLLGCGSHVHGAPGVPVSAP
ncbi:hypothetical protein AZG88_30515 [Rhodococcus sp. LB1]|nr:hypothetical protein AZG88_30515 [Rhodococcus sp. LB1]